MTFKSFYIYICMNEKSKRLFDQARHSLIKRRIHMTSQFDWYTFAIPGVVFLAAIIPVLKKETIKKILSVPRNEIFAYTLVVGIAAYYTGYLCNIIGLELVRPLIGYFKTLSPGSTIPSVNLYTLFQTASSELHSELKDMYEGIVFYRLMFAGFLILSISSIIGFLGRRDGILIRSLVFVISLSATIAFYNSWDKHRIFYEEFTNIINMELWQQHPTH